MIDMTGLWGNLDHLISRVASPRLFFSGGLGDVEFLQSLPLSADVSAADVAVEKEENSGKVLRRTLRFYSPAKWLPEQGALARAEMILPTKFASSIPANAPIFLHFAATGDETTLPRRKLLGEPLAERGIVSILLENPYYGRRRPKFQNDFVIGTLSDQFKMNQATILEGMALLKWLHSAGHRNLGLTGISMGGSMAASVAAASDLPVSVVACIAPVGPGPAFCYGALANRIDWQTLAPELSDYLGSNGGFANGKFSLSHSKRQLHRLMSVADLRNFAPPLQPERAILIAAENDGYVPLKSVVALHKHWKGSQLRTIPGGHVSAVLLNGHVFRDAIAESAFQYSP
ncbi:MAG: alpha/beta hydrolase family protein [Leptospiraceae bacterium]|nr:alpha/beta hydrolase family protein [Leptospiraceae bacterium]